MRYSRRSSAFRRLFFAWRNLVAASAETTPSSRRASIRPKSTSRHLRTNARWFRIRDACLQALPTFFGGIGGFGRDLRLFFDPLMFWNEGSAASLFTYLTRQCLSVLFYYSGKRMGYHNGLLKSFICWSCEFLIVWIIFGDDGVDDIYAS